MFVKPRPALEKGAIRSAAGPFLMVAGVLVFVHMVQHYVKHMTPIISAEQQRQRMMDHKMDSYYEGPCGAAGVHIADQKTTDAVQQLICKEVNAVVTDRSSEALALAGSSYQGSSPIIYTACMKQQFPQLFYFSKHVFGPTIIVNGGQNAIQQVTTFSGPNTAWNFNCTAVNQPNGWRIQTVEFEGYSSVGSQYTGENGSAHDCPMNPQDFTGRF